MYASCWLPKNDIINVGDLTNKIYPIEVRENYRITSNAAMLKRGGSRTQPLSSGDGYDTITKVKIELHINLKKKKCNPSYKNHRNMQHDITEKTGGRGGRDRMVVGFTTTHAIWCCELEPRSWRGLLDTTLCDTVCQWLVIGRWFSPGTPVSSSNKTHRHPNCYYLLTRSSGIQGFPCQLSV